MQKIALPIINNKWILLMMFVTLFSCKKDISNNSVNDLPGDAFPVPAASPVTGDLSGRVVDENNHPVNGAAVTIGSITTTTNSDGIFNVNHVAMDKYVTTVTVTQAGYFKAYRSFSANDSRNYVNIKMIPKVLAGSFQSTANNTITLANGTIIGFQANSVKFKNNNAAYSGTVNVYASYIDPTAADIAATVPGSFMGTDGNSMFVLRSAGMIAVELETDGGQALQLVDNKPASIQLPIPASILTKAPATIDTWSLNEQGIWKKEGAATRNGNSYEMTVSHFSFWNCDYPCNAIYLTINVLDQNNHPIPNAQLTLNPQVNTFMGTGYGITSNNGTVSGLVPAAEVLQMKIDFNIYNCPQSQFVQNIGPFNNDEAITVNINVNQQSQISVSGTATGCNGVPLSDGLAMIVTELGAYVGVPIVSGQYSASILDCGLPSAVSVTVIDNATNMAAGSGSVPVTGTSVTIPNIDLCNSHTIILNDPSLVWDASLCYRSDVPSLANTNYGSINELPVFSWTVNSAPVSGRALMGFDLSTLPANITIDSATLNLFGMPVNFASGAIPQGNSGDNVLVIQRVTQPWDEFTVTWNNQPTSTNVGEVETPASTSTWEYNLLNIDVTSHIQSMAAGNNYGFMIKLKTESVYRSIGFMSSDYTDATRRPFLKIVYH